MLHPAFGSERPSRAQRTSSVDQRSEITPHTLSSLLTLLKPREYFLTVDNCPIWRKHMSWAKTDGKELRQLLTNKFGTNMVFMSLLLGAEMNVLFNSNQMCTTMRHDMEHLVFSANFLAGITIVVSVICTIFTILTTFAAWSMVSCISDENSHALLRSSIGQYCCFMPQRFIVAAIYSFLIWIALFIHIMMPYSWSMILIGIILALFFHVMAAFSAFGRLILHSGAMGCAPIFDSKFEEELLPRGLHTSLLFKAIDELRKGTSVISQYKFPARPIGRVDSMDDLEKSQPAVHFSDSARPSPFVPIQESTKLINAGRRHSRTASETSFGSYPLEFLSEWVGSAPGPPPLGSVECRQSGSFDLESPQSTAKPLSEPMRPKSEPSFTAPLPPTAPIRRKDSMNSSARSTGSLTKFRPNLLNAGSHTQKSIRRMADELMKDDTDDAHNGFSEHVAADDYQASAITSRQRECTLSHKEEVSPRNTNDAVEGTEKERLLPKPALRPPTYTRDNSQRGPPLPPGSGNKIGCRKETKQHSRGESDSLRGSAANVGPSVTRPKGMRKRAETAELIDIVSKCVSPDKLSPKKEESEEKAQSEADELDRLL